MGTQSDILDVTFAAVEPNDLALITALLVDLAQVVGAPVVIHLCLLLRDVQLLLLHGHVGFAESIGQS